MFETFLKQNINFLEILFTDFFIVDSYFKDENKKLMNLSDEIANYNKNQLFRCTLGMASSKRKNMEKATPATIKNIKKFGYDPKNFHHILRLEEFMKRHTSGESFRECLKSKNREYLISSKQGDVPLFKAIEIADKSLENILKLKEKHSLKEDICDLRAAKKLNEPLLEIIKKSLKREMNEEE